jgi:hypothetical protein
MKTLSKTMLAVLAGIALAAQANAVTNTFSFQENGSNMILGNTSTFTEGGFSLTASGFLTAGGPTALYAKFTSGDATETGLGTNIDPSGEHEIINSDFIQLTLPTTPPSNFQMVLAASVQSGESAKVFFTTTAGSLTGATLLGTLTGNGSIAVPAADQTGFIDIQAGSGNVLLQSATISSAVPEGGSAVALLGIALAGIEGVRRTLRAHKAS